MLAYNKEISSMSAVVDSVEVEEKETFSLYVVGLRKLIILFVSTLGFYGLYWSYKNWSIYNKSSNEKVIPILRAFFDVFFVHSLCSKIKRINPKIVPDGDSFLEWNATKYVLLVVLSRITDRLAENEVGMPYTYYVAFLLLPFSCNALCKIQKHINLAMNDEQGLTNSKLTWANYIWIIVGLIVWVLLVLGGYLVSAGEV